MELILKAKNNDEISKNIIINKYKPLLYKNLNKYKYIVGYEFEDLYQYGVLTILKAIKEFDEEKSSSFGAYLKFALNNNFAYLCRRENDENKKTTSLNVTNEEGLEIIDLLEDEKTIEKIYMENMEVQRILDSIEKLDIEEKELCKHLIKNESRGSLKNFSDNKNIPYHKILYRKKVLSKKLKAILKNV